MSLTEPTTSHPFEEVTPLGEDARRAAESPTTWTYLRTLSGAPAAGAPDWADDGRLDELFSAWAKAALAADVVTDRGFTPMEEPAWTRPEPAPRPDAPVDDAVSAYDPTAPYGPVSAYEPAAAYDPPGLPTGGDLGFPAAEPELPRVWSRGDDEIIPQRRRRRGLRRR